MNIEVEAYVKEEIKKKATLEQIKKLKQELEEEN